MPIPEGYACSVAVPGRAFFDCPASGNRMSSAAQMTITSHGVYMCGGSYVADIVTRIGKILYLVCNGELDRDVRGVIAIILGEECAEYYNAATDTSHAAHKNSHPLSLLCFPMRYVALWYS